MDNEFDFTAGMDGFEDFDEIYASIFGEQEALRKQQNSDETPIQPADDPAEDTPEEIQAEDAAGIPAAEAESAAPAEEEPAVDEPSGGQPQTEDRAAEEEKEEVEFDSRFHLDRDKDDKR